MSLLDWGKDAAELEALVRALDFGEYPNLLSCPKIIIENEAVSVSAATASEEDSGAAPGSVLGIDEGQLNVACTNGVLSLNWL